MAEECEYYYYQSGYCCAVRRDKENQSSIDEDTVKRYCWGYHYEDCPRYKSIKSSNTGCYLTSACVEAKGLADDCVQLQTLRSFRDDYLSKTEEGKQEIKEYYLTAPKIVKSIQSRDDSMIVFETIFNELVEPCVGFINDKKYEQAHKLYRNYTLRLKEQFA